MALSRCTDQLNDGSSSEAELGASVSMLLEGRRRVRATLGLPADELDKAAAPGGRSPDVAFQGHLPPGHAAPGAVVRVLFWPRDQVQAAHQRWPTLVQTPETESVIREREFSSQQGELEGPFAAARSARCTKRRMATPTGWAPR